MSSLMGTCPSMYPINGENRGVIITESMRSKFGRGKFGYMIFGESQDDTKTIEERLEDMTSKI